MLRSLPNNNRLTSLEGKYLSVLSLPSSISHTIVMYDMPGHQRIDIPHLVAGTLREETGVAGKILRSADVSLESVRQHLRLGEADTY